MIILKGQVPHTTHSYKKTFTQKKRVEKERQHKKAKYTGIKQRKAILALSCPIIYILFHLLKKHKANRRFWDSKNRKIFPLQGLQAKALEAQVSSSYIIIQWGADKAGGAPCHPDPEIRGGAVSKNIFSALQARPQFGLKIRGGPGPPKLLP